MNPQPPKRPPPKPQGEKRAEFLRRDTPPRLRRPLASNTAGHRPGARTEHAL